MAALLTPTEVLAAIKRIVGFWLSGKITNESAMKEVAATIKKAP